MLLERGLRSQAEHLPPAPGGYQPLTPRVMEYVTTVGFKNVVGIRNQKELKTLAQALDAILTGNLCLAGDTLMQRLKALEQASADGTWAAAEYLEVTPRGSATSVPQEEREQALGEARRAARSEAALRRVTPRQES